MASQMNCAGYDSSNSAEFRHGAPNCANGIAPESNHTSMTSGTRLASAPQSGQAITTSSTNGRCGSMAVTSVPASDDSSASDPTQVAWSEGQIQTGSGVPQYRVLDSAQSTLLRSQSPYLP